MTRMKLIRTVAAWRPDLTGYRDVTMAYRIVLQSLARRSIGYESASQLLITVGENFERLHSEANFAALCGASPASAFFGQTRRYRLNRCGNRARIHETRNHPLSEALHSQGGLPYHLRQKS